MELDWIANHLAHDVRTHKDFYRKHDSVVELAKISKLLLATEYGKIAKFAGKSLKDISVDGKTLLYAFIQYEDYTSLYQCSQASHIILYRL